VEPRWGGFEHPALVDLSIFHLEILIEKIMNADIYLAKCGYIIRYPA
jgi:hypothetical protein